MNLLSEAALSAGTRGVVTASLEHLRRPRRAGGDQSRQLNLPPAARVKSLPGARSWITSCCQRWAETCRPREPRLWVPSSCAVGVSKLTSPEGGLQSHRSLPRV